MASWCSVRVQYEGLNTQSMCILYSSCIRTIKRYYDELVNPIYIYIYIYTSHTNPRMWGSGLRFVEILRLGTSGYNCTALSLGSGGIGFRV